MGSKKKRNSSKKPRQRQGLSGNPALRAEQLTEEQASYFGDEDPLLPTVGFGPAGPEVSEQNLSSLIELARTMAGGAEPADWWPESHDRVLERARAVGWPVDPAGIEETTCSIIGRQLSENSAEHDTGHHLTPWLAAVAEHAGAALRDALASGAEADDGWRPLWALLRGIVLTAPLSTTSTEDREAFSDIKYPHETAVSETEKAAAVLSSRGLLGGGLLANGPAGGRLVPEARSAGTPLVARDAYGARFLIAAPFDYVNTGSGDAGSERWYAWDVDVCWIDMVVAAGTFGSSAEALAEWQSAVGGSASTAELSACGPDMAGWLLGSCLREGAFAEMPHGGEPEELRREYFRSRRRAQVLAGAGLAVRADADLDSDSGKRGIWKADGRFWKDNYKEESRKIRNEFRKWHAEQYGKRVADVSQGAETIIGEWGPRDPFDERVFFSCSPHRVEYAAHLISDGYLDDYASRALRILPDWVRWCAERSEISAEAAETALAAARAVAELATEKGTDAIPEPVIEDQAFRRAE
ncbi:MAG: hypothetical protein ACRDN0_39780 [Trebonia sp.]